MEKNDILEILKDKRFQWTITIVFLLITVFLSTSIRLSNWNILNDQTTGQKIPSDLDAFYYLRVAEKIVDTNNNLPSYDDMRYLPLKVPYTLELMPRVNAWLYHVANNFGSYTVAEVNAFLPVGAFFIGILLFFILAYLLTDSKLAAISSTVLLAFIPSYLQRTVGGFSDHDSLGIMIFFSFLVFYAISLRYLQHKGKVSGAIKWGVITSFFTAFATVGWGGVTTYIFFIAPLAFLIMWLTNVRREGIFAKEAIGFYAAWMIATPIMGLIFGLSPLAFIQRYMLSTVGLIGPFTLGFIVLDYLLLVNSSKLDKISLYKPKYRAAYTLGILLVLGAIMLPITGMSITSMLSDAWMKIFQPWGTERVTLTVAENAQPYIVDIMATLSKTVFWLFVAGALTVGYSALSKIENKKRKFFAYFFWTTVVCGALFTRISSTSMLQGTNFLSQAVYMLCVIPFMIYFVWLYFSQERLEIKPTDALIISLVVFLITSLRASMRHLFAINPFICLIVGYFIYKTYEYLKGNKGEIVKPLITILMIVVAISGVYSIYTFEKVIDAQTKQIGPSANYQWQYAMAWVRNNTPERSIFVHWWDYGYWVQYMGQRPTVTDGGHGSAYWDHLIGRYLLTTTDPKTAFSFMKTHDVSYLLIDPTDLGKYPAYSIIGSDEGGKDRYSAIPVMTIDQKQTLETGNETVIVYTGGMFLDQDISYTIDGRNVFLPAEKAGIGGILWKIQNSGGIGSIIDSPVGVYFYNGQRYDIPLRYVYINNKLVDTGKGIDAVVRIIPSFDGAQSVSAIGAAVYLSPKVSKGLYAQLYLLNNSFGKFNGIDLVHQEDDIVVKSLRQQGAPINEFIYYGGFRGPLDIWSIKYPNNTATREEFLSVTGTYAQFDNLTFTK